MKPEELIQAVASALGCDLSQASKRIEQLNEAEKKQIDEVKRGQDCDRQLRQIIASSANRIRAEEKEKRQAEAKNKKSKK